MNDWRGFKKIMGSRMAGALGWPVAVLLVGVLAAPYVARTFTFLLRPATAAFLGGLLAVLLFRTLASSRR
jgi:hypothetical protein